MPVGTQGTVKGVTPLQLRELGAEIILANTYHLFLRPGSELIEELGGLHKVMQWDGPILTDSGGYQVFSLAKFRDVRPDGVVFQSHLDGSKQLFTPELVIEIQKQLGVDIMMVLDECLPYPSEPHEIEASLGLTQAWAKRSLEVERSALLFGILQGGFSEEWRQKAAQDLIELNFDGFAIGGVSVGEPSELLHHFTEYSATLLPAEKPRYLMGVGYPHDIVHAVASGVDMFDCVIPTRSARFGRLFIPGGTLNIRNQEFRRDSLPVDENCDCYTCRNFCRAYLAHLVHAKEVLAVTLCTIHNLSFYQRLMREIQKSIEEDRFEQFASTFNWKNGNWENDT